MPWFPDFVAAVELTRQKTQPRVRPMRSRSTSLPLTRAMLTLWRRCGRAR